MARHHLVYFEAACSAGSIRDPRLDVWTRARNGAWPERPEILMIILGAELPDEGLLLHLETSAKLLKLLGRIFEFLPNTS